MATCNFIRETKQNESSMRAVIRYVSQDAKTVDKNGRRYLSGVNCMGESAFDEFMATKNLFGKCKGTYFYHYEQSFRPGEIAFYDEAHLIGTELAARMFAGYEVLVGTHLDAESDGAERVHNHFVINSVSFETAKSCSSAHIRLSRCEKSATKYAARTAFPSCPNTSRASAQKL
ncbi:MAG: relaxase/mobilization nuclease domain-containing protein [Clostridia bacterium]|nr:relaxase/mobilization nuclease domain-containing protein [Clostridia bacterium]